MTKTRYIILLIGAIITLLCMALGFFAEKSDGAPLNQCWDVWGGRYVYAKYSHTFPIEGVYVIRTINTAPFAPENDMWVDFYTRDIFVYGRTEVTWVCTFATECHQGGKDNVQSVDCIPMEAYTRLPVMTYRVHW